MTWHSISASWTFWQTEPSPVADGWSELKGYILLCSQQMSANHSKTRKRGTSTSGSSHQWAHTASSGLPRRLHACTLVFNDGAEGLEQTKTQAHHHHHQSSSSSSWWWWRRGRHSDGAMQSIPLLPPTSLQTELTTKPYNKKHER